MIEQSQAEIELERCTSLQVALAPQRNATNQFGHLDEPSSRPNCSLDFLEILFPPCQALRLHPERWFSEQLHRIAFSGMLHCNTVEEALKKSFESCCCCSCSQSLFSSRQATRRENINCTPCKRRRRRIKKNEMLLTTEEA